MLLKYDARVDDLAEHALILRKRFPKVGSHSAPLIQIHSIITTLDFFKPIY